MSSKLDQSLSSIIEQSKPSRPPNRPLNRRTQTRPNRSRPNPLNRQNDYPLKGYAQMTAPYYASTSALMNQFPQQQSSQQQIIGDTISISNLAKDVTAQDLRDIFESIGGIRDCKIFYDSNGHSLGAGEVRFSTAKQAARAVEEYDMAEIDGKVAKIALIGKVVSNSNQTNSNGINTQMSMPMMGMSGFGNYPLITEFGSRSFASRGQRRDRPDRRNIKNDTRRPQNRRAPQRAQSRRNEKRPVDAAALDAELENYRTQTDAVADESGQPVRAKSPSGQ